MGAILCPPSDESWPRGIEPTYVIPRQIKLSQDDIQMLTDTGVTQGMKFGMNRLNGSTAPEAKVALKCSKGLVNIKSVELLEQSKVELEGAKKGSLSHHGGRSCQFRLQFSYDCLQECYMTFYVYAIQPGNHSRTRYSRILEKSIFQSPALTLSTGRNRTFDSHEAGVYISSEHLPGYVHVHKYISPTIFDVVIIVANSATNHDHLDHVPTSHFSRSFSLSNVMRTPSFHGGQSHGYNRVMTVHPQDNIAGSAAGGGQPPPPSLYRAAVTNAADPKDVLVVKQVFYCKLNKNAVLAFNPTTASKEGRHRKKKDKEREKSKGTDGHRASSAPETQTGVELPTIDENFMSVTPTGSSPQSGGRKGRRPSKSKQRPDPTYHTLQEATNGGGPEVAEIAVVAGEGAKSIEEQVKEHRKARKREKERENNKDKEKGAENEKEQGKEQEIAAAAPSSSEQNNAMALEIIKHCYVLSTGTVFLGQPIFGLPRENRRHPVAELPGEKAEEKSRDHPADLVLPFNEHSFTPAHTNVIVSATPEGESIVLGSLPPNQSSTKPTPRSSVDVSKPPEEEEEKEKECMVCLASLRNAILYPCRHCCMCIDCAVKCAADSQKCPVCREPIKLLMQVA